MYRALPIHSRYSIGNCESDKERQRIPYPREKVTQNNESFSFGDSGQKETVSPTLDSDNALSVNVTAANAIVINADTNATLYQKNGADKISPASTAKMITALTVLDYCSPDDEMRVGAEIEMMHDDSSRAWLMKGDILTVRQLLPDV